MLTRYFFPGGRPPSFRLPPPPPAIRHAEGDPRTHLEFLGAGAQPTGIEPATLRNLVEAPNHYANAPFGH